MSSVRKILFTLSFAVLALIAASFLFIADPPVSEPAYADANDNVYGHAWAETVGWFSFNCASQHNRCEGDLSVTCAVNADCVAAGAGATCLADCGDSDYGVSIDDATGDLSGYAWSPNAGWISFNRADTGAPPAQPYLNSTIIAHYNSGNGQIDGWAKVLSMGENGWLKLRRFSSDGGPDYGLAINENGEFTGWAWGGNSDGSGIGWVSFNCADSGAGGCSASNYKVYRDTPPSVTAVQTVQPDYCLSAYQDARLTILSWTYEDAGGQAQASYEVEVATNSGFGGGSVVVDTGKTAGSAVQKIVSGADGLVYNQQYYWRVRVWDAGDQVSGWSSTGSFTTPRNNYPDVDFSYDPDEPRALESVAFTSAVTIYSGGSPSYLWEFTQASETATTTPNPTVQFSSIDGATAALTATDTSGYICGAAADIGVGISLPLWREIKPR